MTTCFQRLMRRAVLASALFGLQHAACAQPRLPDADQTAYKVAASICASCHGPAGVSTSPVFPRLAGQQEPYLVAQLKAFKARTRGEQDAHDYMWGMATLLDDSVIEALARYYAAQKPGAGIAGNPQRIARGKMLFEQGDPSRHIVACSTCHGADAQGNGIFPRLAGQHAAYVLRQLEVIQRKFRASPIMHGVIKDLDANDMKAVAAYVQSR